MSLSSRVLAANAVVVLSNAANAPRLGTTIPDRVSIEPESPYYSPDYRLLGVKFDGTTRKNDVVEFCVSEGWAKVYARVPRTGKPKVERGRYVTVKISGKIEPFWRTS